MTFAKIAMNEASATPIMSAAAVAAVRPGRRDAFWAASEPGTPEMRRIGQAMTVTSSGTSRLESAAIEPNRPIVPAAISSRRAPTLPGSPMVPSASAEPARTSDGEAGDERAPPRNAASGHGVAQAHGRCDAARAQGRDERGDERDADADDQARQKRRRRECDRHLRDRQPHRIEERDEACAERDAGGGADD